MGRTHQTSNLSSNMTFLVLLSCSNKNIDNSKHGTKSKLQHFIPLSFMLNPLMVNVWGQKPRNSGLLIRAQYNLFFRRWDCRPTLGYLDLAIWIGKKQSESEFN